MSTATKRVKKGILQRFADMQPAGIEIDDIQPLDDRVLVKRIIDVPVSSIIIIPDCAKQKSTRGVVLAVGPGKILNYDGGKKQRRPMSLKPGDVVVFGPWDDAHGQLGGDYALIQEDDVRYKELTNGNSRS